MAWSIAKGRLPVLVFLGILLAPPPGATQLSFDERGFRLSIPPPARTAPPAQERRAVNTAERLLGEVGTDRDGGRLFVAGTGNWCRDGVADATLRSHEPARIARAQAAAQAELAQQGLRGAELDRAYSLGHQELRKKLAQDAVALLGRECPDLRMMRLAHVVQGRDGFRLCARADRDWALLPGRCDAISDRNERAFDRLAIDGVLANEAEVRGWSELQATSLASSRTAMGGVDFSAMGAGPDFARALRTRSPLPPAADPFLVERLLAERRYAEARDALRPLLTGKAAQGMRGMRLTQLAAVHEGLGQPAEAVTVLQEAVALERQDTIASNFVRPALLRLGTLYERGGRFEDAAAIYRRGIALARERQAKPDSPPLDIQLERDFQMRGALLLQRQALSDVAHREGLAEQADALFGQALATAYRQISVMRRVPVPADPRAEFARAPWRVELLHVVLTAAAWARLAHERGDDMLAESLARPALRALRQLPYETPVAAEMATLVAALDRDLPGFDRALASMEALFGPDDPAMAFALDEQARILLAAGRPAEALAAARRATGILVRRAERTSGDQGLDARAELAGARRVFDTHLQAARQQADAAPAGADALLQEGFLLAQQLQQTAAGQALARTMGRLASGSDAAAALLRERQDVVERWAVLDREALAATLLPPAQREGGEARRRAVAELATRRTELDAQLRRLAPDLAELARPRVLGLPQVQALLAADEAAVLFHVGAEGSHVWAVTAQGAAWSAIPAGAAALDEAVGRLRSGLDHGGSDAGSFMLARANRLHQTLFSGVEPLLRDRRRLLLVPDGALESLPFGVLVTAPPAEAEDPPAAYLQAAWLIRRHSLLTLPSMGSLDIRRLAPAAAAEPFLGFGDPLLEGRGSGSRGLVQPGADMRGIADVGAVRRMNRLPDSADEIRALARATGAREADAVLLGAEATEARLQALNRAGTLERRRIIAFATHGLVADSVAGITEPALVLTPPAVGSAEDDGLLTASEVAGLRLGADWVVLSACNTAAGGRPGAENLSGLARAFLHAGARSLLVSHWPVASDAAVALTTAALEAIRADQELRRPDALRLAMLGFIDGSRPAADADPWRWAPFVVVGGRD